MFGKKSLSDLDEGLYLKGVLSRAVEASAGLVEPAGRVDVLNTPHSLCLQTGRPNEFLGGLFRRQRWVIGVFGLLGCLLLVALVALAVHVGGVPAGAPQRGLLVTLAVVCLGGGLLCFVLAAMGAGWLYRRALRAQLAALRGQPNLSQPHFVEVEYPGDAASTAPPAISDVGCVFCAPAHERIIVEGVLLRHVIRAEDVLQLQRVEIAPESDSDPAVSVRIHYRIDQQTSLILGLEHDSLRADFLRRYFGRAGLFEKIREALAGV